MKKTAYVRIKYDKVPTSDAKLGKELVAELMRVVGERGDDEGAVECLERVIRERDILLRREIDRLLKNC